MIDIDTKKRSALVPQIVLKHCKFNCKILDFGAGDGKDTMFLKSLGRDVTSWDLVRDPTIHDESALSKMYDAVFANNVLNTISDDLNLELVIRQMVDLTRCMLIVNYPTKRKSNKSPLEVWRMLQKYFDFLIRYEPNTYFAFQKREGVIYHER